MKKLKYIVPIFMGIIICLSRWDSLWTFSDTISVSDIILNLGFGTVMTHMLFGVEVIFWYMPIFMAHVLFGTRIYKRFCSASAYYFSRTPDRVRWYLAESVKLCGGIIVYVLLLFATNVAIPFIMGRLKPVSAADIILFLYYVGLYSMFLFVTTQCINLLSIRLSANMGFVVTELFSLAGFVFYTAISALFGENYIQVQPAVVRFNPAAHLILYIHSSRIDFINVLINGENIDFMLGESIALYGAASLLILAIGCVVIRRTDVIRQGE